MVVNFRTDEFSRLPAGALSYEFSWDFSLVSFVAISNTQPIEYGVSRKSTLISSSNKEQEWLQVQRKEVIITLSMMNGKRLIFLPISKTNVCA